MPNDHRARDVAGPRTLGFRAQGKGGVPRGIAALGPQRKGCRLYDVGGVAVVGGLVVTGDGDVVGAGSAAIGGVLGIGAGVSVTGALTGLEPVAVAPVPEPPPETAE